MKQLLLTGIFICGFIVLGLHAQNVSLKAKVQFASIDKAKELLTTEDHYTKSWSQFDIDSRLQKANSKKEDLISYISSQALEWSSGDKAIINFILGKIDESITQYGYKINFPDTIYFIKSTGLEEGGADSYIRRNCIVLKEDVMGIEVSNLQILIIHELFHILSRNDLNFKKKMYQVIGFKLMKEIAYPPHIKKWRITNPDCPQTDSYITLKKNGKPIDCAMILFSASDYTKGDMFSYLNVGFLKLKGKNTGQIEYVNGKPLIFGLSELTGFKEQVGENTQNLLNPEEILADNFTFALYDSKGLTSQWVVDKMVEKLKE